MYRIRRIVILVVCAGAIWYVARDLGLLDSAPVAAYKHFAHARAYRRPAEARDLAAGSAVETVLPIDGLSVSSASETVQATATSPDGQRVSITAAARVCVGGTCTNYRHSVVSCKTEQGWKVCSFSESPAP